METKTTMPTINWDRLNVGEYERTMLEALAHANANPVNKAKASAFNALAAVLYIFAIGLCLCFPSLIFWLWRA